MGDPFIGEIRTFGFDFAPRSWAFCEGQLLAIQQNTALFSLLGNVFGGDGRTNFALPNLKGRVPIGSGNGQGLKPRTQGMIAGSDTVSIDTAQMPWHTHTLTAQNANSQVTDTYNASLAKGGKLQGKNLISWPTYTAGPSTMPMSNQAISISGGNQPHENCQPSLVINYCIALQGIYPPRP